MSDGAINSFSAEQLTVRLWVRQYLAGDQAAAGDILSQFHQQVLHYCQRILLHRQDAEDAAQEAFARAFRHLSQWDQQRPFAPWLLAIAGNRCRSKLAQRGIVTHSLSSADASSTVPDCVATVSLVEELSVALDSLRAEHRDAFLLFHGQHLSYEEIAAELDRPLGTVKTWVHRARRELARRLSSDEIAQSSIDVAQEPTHAA